MYSTALYLYKQTQKVLLQDTYDYPEKRWRLVYAKNLKLSRGVDNTLRFEFLNQDQRPIILSNFIFTFRIISEEEIIFSKQLVITDDLYGKAKLLVTEQEIRDMAPQRAYYTISIYNSSTGLIEPVYVDDQANMRGVIEIVDSVFPKMIESRVISTPVWPIDSSIIVYSDIWQSNDYYHTLQYRMNDFSGRITVQMSDTTDGEWYDIDIREISEITTATRYWNIEGWYINLRLKIEWQTGHIDNILVR
jgi:hypothetical protein